MNDKGFWFELDQNAVKELMKSPGVRAVVEEEARKVQSRAGDGFEVEMSNTRTRVKARIHPDSAESFYKNRKHDTLVKALFGGK